MIEISNDSDPFGKKVDVAERVRNYAMNVAITVAVIDKLCTETDDTRALMFLRRFRHEVLTDGAEIIRSIHDRIPKEENLKCERRSDGSFAFEFSREFGVVAEGIAKGPQK